MTLGPLHISPTNGAMTPVVEHLEHSHSNTSIGIVSDVSVWSGYIAVSESVTSQHVCEVVQLSDRVR